MKSQQLANRCAVLTAALVFVGLSATSGEAQTSSGFAALQKHIHKEVTVDTTEGSVQGQLLRVEASRIVVYDAGRPKPISRESVRRVTKHNSRHTGAWIAGMSAAGHRRCPALRGQASASHVPGDDVR